jgi:hypothetical protein
MEYISLNDAVREACKHFDFDVKVIYDSDGTNLVCTGINNTIETVQIVFHIYRTFDVNLVPAYSIRYVVLN